MYPSASRAKALSPDVSRDARQLARDRAFRALLWSEKRSNSYVWSEEQDRGGRDKSDAVQAMRWYKLVFQRTLDW